MNAKYLALFLVLIASVSAWYDANYFYRIPITLNDSQTSARMNEPVTLNVSSLSLFTDSCKEIIVTYNYTSETLASRQILNTSGQTLADGSAWCQIKFNVNLSTVQNATFAKANNTVLWVYYGSFGGNYGNNETNWAWNDEWNATYLANDSVNYYNGLKWNGSVTGAPVNEITSDQYNSVYHFNTTASVGNTSYYNKTTSNGTIEVRHKLFAYAGGYSGYRLAAMTTMSGKSHLIGINDTGLKVDNWLNATVVGYFPMADAKQWHTYRIVFNGSTGSIYIDGNGTPSLTYTLTSGDSNYGRFFGNSGNAVINDAMTDYYAYAADNWYAPVNSSQLASEQTTVQFFLNTADEETNAPLVFNATIYNNSNTVTFVGQTQLLSTAAVLPNGFATIQVVNYSGGYYQRTLYETINATTLSNRTAYLLKTSSGQVVRFHVQSNAQAPIVGASVNIYKNFGSAYKLVDQGVTDSTGTATAFLSPTTTYLVSVSSTNYGATNVSILPSGSDYTITLSSTTAVIPDFFFADLNYSFIPQILSMNKTITPVRLVVQAANNLDYWGLNISYAGAWIYNETSTSASGGTIAVDLNNSARSNYITTVIFIKKTGYDFIWTKNTTFYIYNITTVSNYSLADSMTGLANDLQFSPSFAAPLLALIVAGFAGVWLGQYTWAGGGVVALAILGIFVSRNDPATGAVWFPTWAFVLVCIAVASILILRSREV